MSPLIRVSCPDDRDLFHWRSEYGSHALCGRRSEWPLGPSEAKRRTECNTCAAKKAEP
jgi:hypothetical protein